MSQESLMVLEDEATRCLVEALLDQSAVRIRRRWAKLQAQLWIEQGWLQVDSTAEHYSLTAAGRTIFLQQHQEWLLRTQPDAEQKLQRLGIELPAQLPPAIFAALLFGDRHHRWQPAEWAQLAEQGLSAATDQPLRFRTRLPMTLFLQQGDLLDMQSWIRHSAECVLPVALSSQIAKILWTAQPPGKIVTIESRAAYLSYPLAADELVVFAPAGMPSLWQSFLRALPPGFLWAHLCDLHPDALMRCLQWANELSRAVCLMLPDNLSSFVNEYGIALSDAHAWSLAALPRAWQSPLGYLFTSGRWLQQEVFTLTPRWVLSAPASMNLEERILSASAE